MSGVSALPRYALENGSSCILCHVNPTGMGLRNEYGLTFFSQEDLPAKPGKLFKDYTGIIANHIRVGGDFRLQSVRIINEDLPNDLSIFPMQASIEAASIGKNCTLHFTTELIQKDFGFQFQIKNLWPNGYLKGGKARPAYGIQLDDHTSFIRGGNLRLQKGENPEGMPFSPFLKTTGLVETGYLFENGFAAISYGDGYLTGSGKTLSCRGEYYTSMGTYSLMFGGSLLTESDIILKGLFGGISRGKWSWMGEVDIAENLYSGTSIASYSEITWRVIRGWTLTGKVDFFDANMFYINDAIHRFTLGMNVVPFPFVDVKFQTRISRDKGFKTSFNPEILTQLHVWF